MDAPSLRVAGPVWHLAKRDALPDWEVRSNYQGTPTKLKIQSFSRLTARPFLRMRTIGSSATCIRVICRRLRTTRIDFLPQTWIFPTSYVYAAASALGVLSLMYKNYLFSTQVRSVHPALGGRVGQDLPCFCASPFVRQYGPLAPKITSDSAFLYAASSSAAFQRLEHVHPVCVRPFAGAGGCYSAGTFGRHTHDDYHH